ncbi:saccharopine dehydrogenase [Chloropicon roscoffensis]|uniref:Saccharopine dehydrogenase n=1 Tax=Chloropicon roscoffensis TaxID=1461544 RepID=A0AAX4PMT9_9CHLO
MAGETETDRVTAAMVALLEKKHKGVKAPVDVIDKWTLLALQQYFESQAYLNSMLMSSSEDDGSAEGAVGESEADEADEVQASTACAAKDARASIPIQALKVEDDDEGRPRQKREARDDRGVLIYGATGYTGRLISKACRDAGLDVTVAGRNAASVRALALELGLPSVSFSLDNEAALDEAVGRAAVVVHCAGPFAQTYSAVVESCLRKGAHYVDINGEIEVIEAISKYAQEAEEKGLMLLPAAGFDVVPSDTLAHLVAERFKSCYPAHFPSKLEIFFHYNDQGALISRGTKNVMKGGKRGVYYERQDGKVVEIPAKPTPLKERKRCDYGRGLGLTVKQANMADVSSAYFSTGIPNIKCFMSDIASMRQLRCVLAKDQTDGPDAAENEEGKSFLFATVSSDGKSHRHVSASLACPAPYKITYVAVVWILQEILQENFKAGFCTPALAYGDALVGACGMKHDL